MPYSNWNDDRHGLLESTEFVSVSSLLLTLNKIRKIPFSVKSERDQARSFLIGNNGEPIQLSKGCRLANLL